ncbi:PQQ-binding-like beta-propeller repeat protein [Streptomyces sp. NPDC004539]|uniref:serine/threonine-protein kinase n=1 Tax=Streptomyces sp. NPDC004539 TaxID=3154280 RepID=UPI0033B80D2B
MPPSPGDAESIESTRSIGDYTLVRHLGSGGMGVVHLARSSSGRQVALKVVHAHYAQDEEFRARFRLEIAAARRVSGAFTPPVVDADPDAGQPWMATLYVPGPTLAEAVAEDGPLGGKALRTLGLGLAEALRDIHQVGLVHRDLKPSNILMAEDGPRVIDFGISRAPENHNLTLTGRLIGTPPFMSPEQFSAPRDVTGASDVFSLGSVLVFAATGTGPFDAGSPYMTGFQIMYEPPRLDGVPEPFHSIVAACLDKNPAARPGLSEVHHMLRTLPDATLRVSSGAGSATDARRRSRHRRLSRGAALAEALGRRAAALPAGASSWLRRGGGWRRTLIGVVAALTVTGLAVAVVNLPPDAAADVQVPEGWRPWLTNLSESSGDSSPLAHGESGCLPGGDAMYCAGTGFTAAKVDPSSGSVLWRTGTNPVQTLPIGVRDGLVYVYAEPDDPDGDSVTGSDLIDVTALDTGTGEPRWTRRVKDYDAEFGEIAPAYLFSGGLLTMSVTATEFVAYGATGEELWRSSASAPTGSSCLPLVLGGNPYGLCAPDDENSGRPVVLLRLDTADGTRRDLATLPPLAEPLGVVDGQLLFALSQTPDKQARTSGTLPYTGLVRVEPGGGEVERIDLAGAQRGRVTTVGDAVYFVRADGTVTAVSPADGRQLWQRATGLESLSEPAVSTTYDAVYFANRFGRLIALDQGSGAVRWRSAGLDDLTDDAEYTAPSLLLVEDAIVAAAGDMAFSVRPDRPDDRPSTVAPN